MRRSLFLIALLPLAILAAAEPPHAAPSQLVQSFNPSIDALSVGGEEINLEVSGLTGDSWSPWTKLTKDAEDDPLSTESNLVIFGHAVSQVRLRGENLSVALHPIRIAADPVHYSVASLTNVGTPKILSRVDWGANESLLYDGKAVTASGDASDANPLNGNGSEALTQSAGRVQDCNLMQQRYPAEFRIARVKTTDANGQHLRWPQQYSPGIRLVVIHHTSEQVSGDARPGVERMRAIYQYHAVSRGWGDIGYHYVIDETGQIYQGRAGGEYVVGGHAYCNNIGTLGIALMGNFEVEDPTQAQAQSLQWLLDTLGKEYNIDYTRNVLFHGKSLPPIVGHRDLLSTSCPGYTLYNALDQIRANVRGGNIGATVNFPLPPSPTSSPASSSASSSRIPPPPADHRYSGVAYGLSAIGSTAISGRPGMDVQVTLQYRTGNTTVAPQAFLGNVFRSSPDIGLWIVRGGGLVRVGKTLLSPAAIPAMGSQTITLQIRLPLARGDTTLKLGGVVYTLSSEGMRLKIPGGPTSASQGYVLPTITSSSSSSSSSSVYVPVTPIQSSSAATMPQTIRVRLTDESLSGGTETLSILSRSIVNGQTLSAGTITLQSSGNDCVGTLNGKVIASGIVRIDAGGGSNAITSWQKSGNRFHGVLECRVLNGGLTFIDELPLEAYMAGISEEPDTEPAAKQEAFAIAARTYAAYWMLPAHRKFPGLPYDASDNPAEFQAFSGAVFEGKNPRWVSIIQKTAGEVLTINGEVLRIPYFSSDDGRTRSPAEVGWTNFPHAEIFSSKPDPWCKGFPLSGHGVGMSGCGAKGQAYEGKGALEILRYYYPGAAVQKF